MADLRRGVEDLLRKQLLICKQDKQDPSKFLESFDTTYRDKKERESKVDYKLFPSKSK